MARSASQRIAFSTLCIFLALSLFIGAPSGVKAANDICFVAIDDTLPFELSSATMPFWDGGVLYVPYTAFDSSTLGVYASLDRSEWILSIYNSNHQLDFYINLMASYDGSGNYYEYKALMRNSVVFVPVNFVCAFFGLGCSYITTTSSCPVVRITSGKQVYSDTTFISQASSIISSRAQNYLGNNTSLPPVVSPVTPPSPSVSVPPDNSDITVALWIDATSPDAAALIPALEAHGFDATFFFDAMSIEANMDSFDLVWGADFGLALSAHSEAAYASLLAANNIIDENYYTKIRLCELPADAPARTITSVGYVPVKWELDGMLFLDDGISEALATYTENHTCILRITPDAENLDSILLLLEGLSDEGCTVRRLWESDNYK